MAAALPWVRSVVALLGFFEMAECRQAAMMTLSSSRRLVSMGMTGPAMAEI
jgi:hypothetical protein